MPSIIPAAVVLRLWADFSSRLVHRVISGDVVPSILCPVCSTVVWSRPPNVSPGLHCATAGPDRAGGEPARPAPCLRSTLHPCHPTGAQGRRHDRPPCAPAPPSRTAPADARAAPCFRLAPCPCPAPGSPGRRYPRPPGQPATCQPARPALPPACGLALGGLRPHTAPARTATATTIEPTTPAPVRRSRALHSPVLRLVRRPPSRQP